MRKHTSSLLLHHFIRSLKLTESQNWRSLVILVLVIVPMLPALAHKVTPNNVHIPIALSNLFSINWLYGFFASCILYYVLNVAFPDRGTLITHTITGDAEVVEGVDSSNASTDEASRQAEKGWRAQDVIQ